MLRVPSLILPENLPHPDAIKSFNDSEHGYDPEFWEFDYESYRYLERMSDASLDETYLAISKNMDFLIAFEKNVIPIQAFHSSWYWFKKEHQTRLEFRIRGRNTPTSPPQTDLASRELESYEGKSYLPFGETIFRYTTKEHAMNLLEKGNLRIQAASEMKKLETDKVRYDDEKQKKCYYSEL